MQHILKRLLSLFLVLALLMPLLPHPEPAMAAPAPLPTTNTPPTMELAGANRIETAVDVSGHGWTTSQYVVIATSQNFPDALAGAPLAHALGAPMLLTPSASLSPSVANEVKRLGATRAIVLGGTGALSAKVIDGLVAAGIPRTDIERVAGADRFETARRIALRMQQASGAAQGVVIANGRNFPDALAVAGWAGRANRPILLTESKALPTATRQALASITSTDTLIVGGTGAVSEAVALEFPGALRIGGADRYETASLIAEHAFANGMSPQDLFVATGENFPDALSAGPLLARRGSILKLTRTATLPSATSTFIERYASGTQRIVILGGKGAVSAAVRSKISEAATTRIAEGVRLVDPATKSQLVSISPDVLVFDNATPLVDDLKEDQILISEPTALAPNGYMRRVLSITSAQGNISVETTGVPIEEVIKDGSIAASQEITPENIESIEILSEGVEVAFDEGPAAQALSVPAPGDERATALGKLPAPKISLNLNRVPLEEARLSISMGLSGSYQFVCQMRNGQVEYARVSASINQMADLSLAGRSATAIGVELARMPLRPVLVMIGKVPVVVSGGLIFVAGMDASGSVQMAFDVEQRLHVQAGLEYKDGEVRRLDDFSPTVRVVNPSVAADVTLQAYAGPRFELRIYEFIGPYIEIKPLIEVVFAPLSDPWWRAELAIDLAGGLQAEIWSVTLFDVSGTWRVAKAEIGRSAPGEAHRLPPPPGEEPPPPPGSDLPPGEDPPTCIGPFVSFPDAALEAAVRLALGNTTCHITVEDMKGLTSLWAWRSGIRNLSGLEFAVNLQEVDLSDNQISDISPLSGLSNLTWLDLEGNQISEISPLSGLANLTVLDLSYNQISDISPLSGLTSLTDLFLEHNQIATISGLSGLTNLTQLELYYNQISDITPLGGLTNLQWLRIHHNLISDITPLGGLTNLKGLRLQNNQISDIFALVANPGLGLGDELALWNNPLSPAALSDVATLRERGVNVWD